jgi:uncharacterized protein (DUF1778 family)
MRPRVAPRPRRVSRLNLRATDRQKRLFETAALRRGVTVTEFVLQSAQTRAEEILAEEQHFVLSPERWNAFVTALDRPVVKKPRLRRLLSTSSVLER